MEVTSRYKTAFIVFTLFALFTLFTLLFTLLTFSYCFLYTVQTALRY